MDLLQIHHFDKDIPIEETIEALHDLVRMGKVRYIRGSSMRTYQFAMIQSCTKAHGWTKIRQHAEPYDLSELSQCQSLSLSFDITRDIKPDISLLNDIAGVCKVGGGFCSYQAGIFSHWVCIDNGWCSSKRSTISVSTDETCETVGSDYNRAVVPSNSRDWRVTPKAPSNWTTECSGARAVHLQPYDPDCYDRMRHRQDISYGLSIVRS
jgi:hypothetical protein